MPLTPFFLSTADHGRDWKFVPVAVLLKE